MIVFPEALLFVSRPSGLELVPKSDLFNSIQFNLMHRSSRALRETQRERQNLNLGYKVTNIFLPVRLVM